MLTEFFLPGLEYQENLAAKYLAKLGHEVVVVSSIHETVFSYYGGERVGGPARVDVNLSFGRLVRLRYRYNLMNKVRPLEGFAALLEQEAPELIFVHDVQPDLTVAADYVRRHRGISLIVDSHADYSNSGSTWISRAVLHRFIRRRYYQKSRDAIARVYPVVPHGLEFLHDLYGVPYSAMEVLPLGADTDLIASTRSCCTRSELRGRFDVEDDDFLIVSGGKLEPRKRLEVLFAAIKQIPGERIRLRVFGESADSAYADSLRILCAEDGRIRMTGWLDTEDTYRLMLASDLAVFPASQSILWQRAIACGLPMICGDAGGQSPDYLNEGNIIVLSSDEISPSRVSESITTLINDPHTLDGMRLAATRVAAERLDWNVLARRIVP